MEAYWEDLEGGKGIDKCDEIVVSNINKNQIQQKARNIQISFNSYFIYSPIFLIDLNCYGVLF